MAPTYIATEANVLQKNWIGIISRFELDLDIWRAYIHQNFLPPQDIREIFLIGTIGEHQ